jgi:hypothetical protein
MNAQIRPVPKPSRWSAPYWEAAAQRRLVIQECRDCGQLIMYPKRFCPHCFGENLGWRDASGKGEIYAVTAQLLGAPTGFADRLPYVIAIIRLDEGVQMMSNIVGARAEDATIGDRVTVDFEPNGEVLMPVFRIESAGALA